ncbi:MAG: hypothetical protein IIU86_03820 [Oscillospiraceae bacterium]|nr:hypothetical protein [Oscillospiraceae bacterium]
MKGGGTLSATGYIQVHAYTSYAQIPLKDVAISITDASGAAIALRLTNRDGALDVPVEIQVPDLASSQSPNTGIIPFAVVNLYARLNNYEAIEIENLQVFPNTTTLQNLEMIPLSEFPDSWNKLEGFNTPPQNL